LTNVALTLLGADGRPNEIHKINKRRKIERKKERNKEINVY